MMTLRDLVRTSDETLATARAFAESAVKTCIVVNRDVAGFVTTRLLTADLTGVDILRHAAHNIYAETVDPKFHPLELISRMVDAGKHGRKPRGVFNY